MPEAPLWFVEFPGRVISKKNSKEIHYNRATRKPFISTSAAYKAWHEETGLKLRPHIPNSPLTGPLRVVIVLYLKGAIDADVDNGQTSIFDLFEDLGVYENDSQIFDARTVKRPGAAQFRTRVEIYRADENPQA